MPESIQCLSCKHYRGAYDTGSHCDAFPYEGGKRIPDEIFSGVFDHRNKHEGDNGILWESNGLEIEDDEPMDMTNQPLL